MSHPEVRSVKCVEVPNSGSFWDALLPAGEDNVIPSPKLESVFIVLYTGDETLTPLSDCLRNREAQAPQNSAPSPVDGGHGQVS